MDMMCDRCDWSPAGKFIECDLLHIGLADEYWSMGYLEVEHFCETGCRGSICERKPCRHPHCINRRPFNGITIADCPHCNAVLLLPAH